MRAEPTWTRGMALLTYGGLAFVVALLIFEALNPVVGPASEAIGIVQGSAFVPADGPPPSKNVWVRLPDGAVVVTNTRTDLPVVPGQEVKLHVYRRLISGTKAYAIVLPDARK